MALFYNLLWSVGKWGANMNDRLKRSLLVGEIILCLLPFFCYAMIYRYLPPEIPIHYNFEGTADRFAAKSSAEIIVLCGIGFMGLLLGMALRKFIAALAKTQEPDNTINNRKDHDICSGVSDPVFCGSLYVLCSWNL